MTAHILVIDDDLATLEMMREVLISEGGYQITLAHMLFEDLSEVERLHPDLILLDFTFGSRQTGWEFLQQLKLRRATMQIPVILCTVALNDVQEQERVLREKGIPILYKPFDIDEMLNMVKECLSR